MGRQKVALAGVSLLLSLFFSPLVFALEQEELSCTKESLSECYEEGVNLFNNKDFEGAKSLFGKVITIDVNYKKASVYLTKCHTEIAKLIIEEKLAAQKQAQKEERQIQLETKKIPDPAQVLSTVSKWEPRDWEQEILAKRREEQRQIDAEARRQKQELMAEMREQQKRLQEEAKKQQREIEEKRRKELLYGKQDFSPIQTSPAPKTVMASPKKASTKLIEKYPPAMESAQEKTRAIMQGDTLYVSVSKVPDLDKSVTVQPDGTITYPLIGKIKATGLTVNALTQELTEQLKNYIKEPKVVVRPQQLWVL